MNNKKTIIILLSAALLIIVVLIVVMAFINSKRAPGKITIQTPNGNVAIKNYTQNPVAELPSTTVIVETPSFTIDNLHGSGPAGSTNSFHILIEAQPIEQVRQQAEQALLNALQITQADACKLNVYLQVTNSADPNLAGTNYGLSFCPSGIQFPAGQ